ncbi:MAG: hypothetical protein V4590_04720 [Bacteroidota bacterium]
MTLFNKSIYVTGIISLLASCGMVGEDAVTVPAYICVPSFTFVTDTASPNSPTYQGANSHKFLDMWISDAGKLIGNIGLPSLIPIQRTGPTQIWVEAGISITGQDEVRESYPLISQHIKTSDLKPGVIDTIYPVFKYLPNIEFKFIEDYDRPGSFLSIEPTEKLPGDTIIRINNEHSWRTGNVAGKVEMDNGHDAMQLISAEFTLPQSGSPVYLEIDYKSNLPLDIGYYYLEPGASGVSPSNSVIRTFPNATWKKLYVKLTDEVATRKVGTGYVIYIALLNIDKIAAEVYIDNVKLVCLKG